MNNEIGSQYRIMQYLLINIFIYIQFKTMYKILDGFWDVRTQCILIQLRILLNKLDFWKDPWLTWKTTAFLQNGNFVLKEKTI